MLALQHGVCKICGRPPKKVRLAVDHDHRFDRVKITVKLTTIGTFKYVANAVAPNGRRICWFAGTRKLARVSVHLELRKLSIRGLLCMNCNRGLQKFYDKPERFEAAASYLREFERRINNEKVFTSPAGNGSSIISSE